MAQVSDLSYNIEILKEYNRRKELKQRANLAHGDLLEFIKFLHPSYQVNWHHKAICDRLTKLKDQVGQRIMIFVGPQRGKSEIVSRYFPAWWLGHHPSSKNILSSYSGDLANSFNRDCQDIIQHEHYKLIFPDLKIGCHDHNLKMTQNEMVTSERGYLFSVGVGGSTTGRSAGVIAGADEDRSKPTGFFCLDDPYKDPADAFSKVKRKAKLVWWQGVVKTRIHKTSNTILMHTRWHKEDLAGWLLEHQAEKWEILSFPELGPDLEHPNEYDPRTDPNEPLWPAEKGGYDELMEIKEEVGSYLFSAMFQQKPKVIGGAIIKDHWINYYTRLPFDIEGPRQTPFVMSWDLQFKETGTSFTAGVTLVKKGADFYVIDMYHKKADVIESKRAIKAMAGSWPMCRTILIENKANGPAIITLLKKEVSGIIPVEPVGQKDERLHLVSPVFEAGNVHFPADHPLTKVFVEELTTFPASPNDDIVDCMSQALERFSKLTGLARLRAYS